MKIFKRIWQIIKNICIVVLVIFTALLVITKIMGDSPSVFGLNMYYIVSPSMEPSLEVGDIIMSKKVSDVNELKVHDVITYEGRVDSYKGKLVTHEIIEIRNNPDGTLSFITKGTKEGAAIDPIVSADQVKSKMLFEVPFLGKIMQFISNKYVFFFLIIIPLAGALVYEVINLVNIFKNKDEEDDENEEN